MKAWINREIELEISCLFLVSDGTINMAQALQGVIVFSSNPLYQSMGAYAFLSAKLLSSQGSQTFPMWEVSVKYYLGFENARKQKREGTKIKELRDMATGRTDFTERDIAQRTTDIIFDFTSYLKDNGLIEE